MICTHCGTYFPRSAGRRTCSDACAALRMKQSMDASRALRSCTWCGRNFHGKLNGRKTCSDACSVARQMMQQEENKANRKLRKCVICGAGFFYKSTAGGTKGKPRALLCSEACKKKRRAMGHFLQRSAQCVECGGNFLQRHPKTVMCSAKCRWTHHNRLCKEKYVPPPKVESPCNACGLMFRHSPNGRHFYCSKRCRVTASGRRSNERVKEQALAWRTLKELGINLKGE